DFFTSLVKLQQINDIYHQLPNIDCCACGSPSCRALAEDIVAGLKRLEDCIVLTQKKRGDNVDT
ncbi:4Fe-4S ferredoxin, partial [Turicibacter sanguinis]|nr:4Fe-4S ferredoxin [Turicibacter sanguinis]